MRPLTLFLTLFLTSCTGNTPCVASHPLEIEWFHGEKLEIWEVCDARTFRIPDPWRAAHDARQRDKEMDAGVSQPR